MILKGIRTYVAALAGLHILTLLAGCGDSAAPALTSTPHVIYIVVTATPEASAATSVPATQASEPGRSFSGKGEAVEISGTVQHQDCIGPLCASEGRRFALFTLKVGNISQELVGVNHFYFNLLTTDQETAPTASVGSSLENPLPLVDLRPGTHTQGQIAFEIAADAQAATLIWYDYSETLEIPIDQ